jgi:RNA polymerase sigma factor (TIGR02999 family)
VDQAALLTDLIGKACAGDEGALQRVFEATYQDLRRLAHLRLSDHQRGPVLDTTALVHESFLRFVKAGELRIEDRRHFLRYAGQTMRSVIVDCARERQAERRGGGAKHVPLTGRLAEAIDADEDLILRVHEALEELSRHDQRMTHVVEMRYFAGMTEVEIAGALGVTERTVRRDWEKARVILAAALG